MLHPTSAPDTPKNTRVRAFFAALAFFTFIAFVPAAYGQADLTFTGGSDSPLTTRLNRSISYTINTGTCGVGGGPYFEFQAVGDVIGLSQQVTGDMAYSVNGGAPIAITNEDSGFVGGDVSVDDHSLYNTGFFGAANGSTVVLSLGFITTSGIITAAPPANGLYTTFITDDNGLRCSMNGVALDPSAANVSIGGRVIVEKGLGLRNAQVSMTDAQGNLRQTVTSSFGYYRFDEVAAGETVFLTVRSKRYTFAPRVVSAMENVSDIDFTIGK